MSSTSVSDHLLDFGPGFSDSSYLSDPPTPVSETQPSSCNRVKRARVSYLRDAAYKQARREEIKERNRLSAQRSRADRRKAFADAQEQIRVLQSTVDAQQRMIAHLTEMFATAIGERDKNIQTLQQQVTAFVCDPLTLLSSSNDPPFSVAVVDDFPFAQ